MELSGRLASFPIAELLSWAANDRRTGSLVLRRSSREKRIYFRDGEIVACLSDSAGDFYGKYLLHEGHIEKPQLLRCLLLCKQRGQRLGSILVEEGIVDREVVERTLGEQIEDLICDVFLWSRGIFFFQADPPPAEEILARPIHTMAVVLEGTRWVDEMTRIRQTLAHDQLLLKRSGKRESAELNPRAAAIYNQLDEQTSVRDLHKAVGGSYYRFLAEVCELVTAGILTTIDEGQMGVSGTYELPLANLLMEQAVEEQLSSVLREVAIPIRLMEPYYPVWASGHQPSDWQGLEEAEQTFLESFDGRRPLDDILSQDPDSRSRQAELLLLLISKGALAFIPPPVEESES